jgi:transposase
LSPFAPSCPSGNKPTFIKKETAGRKRKPGRKKGHAGVTRKRPSDKDIMRIQEETLSECPDCGNPLKESRSKRTRVIIDIQLPAEPETVEHVINQYWCSKCGEMKEKTITDAMPGFGTGLKTIAYSAYLHYHQGMSISKIVENLSILGMKISAGSLVGGWKALAQLLKPCYEEIGQHIRGSTDAVYADETGYRQNGKKCWLWSFSTKNEVFFLIRKSRGGDIVREVLGKVFNGILVTDFWKPYLAVSALIRQWCIAHFLREFKKIEYTRKDLPDEYRLFKKRVKRLFNDALRSSKKKLSGHERQTAYDRFLERLDQITLCEYNDKDVVRLQKRLRKYRDGFFTFVVRNVDATNNHSERIIRYAVIMRKTSFHTMSDAGSETMSILMSVFKTLELRDENVLESMILLAKKAIVNKKLTKHDLAA